MFDVIQELGVLFAYFCIATAIGSCIALIGKALL
jgi:hypothetical protein